VIAGTATAVSGNVAQKQAAQQQAAAQETAAKQAQANELANLQAQVSELQAVPPTPAPVEPGGGDLLSQLQQLASLHQAGILSDAEFSAAKAKLLG
jgi:membrane protease subunit (stomatin/prohibitin family)